MNHNECKVMFDVDHQLLMVPNVFSCAQLRLTDWKLLDHLLVLTFKRSLLSASCQVLSSLL